VTALDMKVADVAALDARLNDASPADIIRAALDAVGRDKLALVSSFGTESAALLKFAADVDPAITLIEHLGLTDVRTIHPLTEDVARQDADRELWLTDPDRCCHLRKVEPLTRALATFEAWLNGRKRFQGGARAAIPVVEIEGARLKFNPLANVTAEELKALYADAKLPQHPLVASGFASVGCMPCSSRSAPGEDARAGRWRGKAKTECGIHVAKT